MEDWNKEEHKEAVKEAFKEWLDEQAANFGKWTLKFFGTVLFGAMCYYLVTHGFLK
jgi:hypothetical protein